MAGEMGFKSLRATNLKAKNKNYELLKRRQSLDPRFIRRIFKNNQLI